MDYPGLYIQNFVSNLFKSGRLIFEGLTSNKYLSLLILAIVIWLRFTSRLTLSYSNQLIPLLLVILAFTLLCSNAFVFYEALWPVAIITYIIAFASLAQSGKLFLKSTGVLIAINIAISLYAVIDYTQSQRTEANGQLVSLSQINTILSEDPDITNKVVMSSHPARAFYAQSQWVTFPAAGYQSACDLITFNYPNKIKQVTPKIPVNMSIDKMKPDYLIVDRRTAERSSQLDSSLNFIQSDCINQLDLLFGTDSVRLYRIKR